MRLGLSSTLIKTGLETAQQQCAIHGKKHDFSLHKCREYPS